MRLIQIIVLFLSIFLAILIAPAETFANNAVIKTDHLNVRSGPGTEFDTVHQVHTNEIYPIIQEQSEWIEIQLTSGSGWIITEYVTIKTVAKEAVKQEDEFPMEKKQTGSITITFDNTHIRSGPSTKEEIIHVADQATEFDLVSENDHWYGITLDDRTGYISKRLISEKPSTNNILEDKRIVVDAGHGGPDVGAIGVSGLFEKDLAYKTALKLKEDLTALGAHVILTRETDQYIRLESRAILTNSLHTDAFISIHYNSFPEIPDITGIGTYFYHRQNEAFAVAMQSELIKATDADDRNISFEDFQVLRQSYQPALLIELGFISNKKSEQLLSTNAYQNKLVKGIINGLQKQLNIR